MSRVEWTRLEGNDVEAVVAMFVNRERPRSVRITPSQGDGGVDILDRNADGAGSDVVLQVKRYTGPLTTGQKNEIERSLRRLKGPDSDDGKVKKDPRWADLRVDEWHLVTPWDPSPEADRWLQELGTKFGVSPVWDGLNTVEQLAAKYPDIVDYYLHGGRERISTEFERVMALFSEHQERQDVPSVTSRVEKALGTLENDPHYRYECSFGEGVPPDPGGRPGLMFSWVSHDQTTGRWIVVDVIARCAASPQERPITVKGAVQVEPGSDADKAFQDFLDFGAPFVSPIGAYAGEMDAPGGLGGPFKEATMSVASAADIGDNPELYLEILDPDDVVLATANLNRVERSTGRAGWRAALEEEHGLFTLESRFALDGTGSRRLELGALTGSPVSAVADALDFVLHCRTPNKSRLSVRHTPPSKGAVEHEIGFLDDDQIRASIERKQRLVRMLAHFQEHSSAVVRVPDLDDLSDEQIRQWQFAHRLLNGDTAHVSYKDGDAIFAELDAGVVTPGASVIIVLPLTAMVGSEKIALGTMHMELDVTKAETRDMGGRTFHVLQTVDRRATYRLAPDDA